MLNLVLCPICREHHAEPAHAALGMFVACLDCTLELEIEMLTVQSSENEAGAGIAA